MINCSVEEYIPIPTSSRPYRSVREKAVAACNAAKLLEQEGYTGAQSTPEQARIDASNIITALAQGKEPPLAYQEDAFDTPSGVYTVRNILSEYDMEIVREAKQLRHYVTNKLVIESDNMDARIRMKALELIGKISDVGLFTERTEVTINNKSTVELEDTLKSKLKRLMGVTSASDVVEATIIGAPIIEKEKIDVRSLFGGK